MIWPKLEKIVWAFVVSFLIGYFVYMTFNGIDLMMEKRDQLNGRYYGLKAISYDKNED